MRGGVWRPVSAELSSTLGWTTCGMAAALLSLSCGRVTDDPRLTEEDFVKEHAETLCTLVVDCDQLDEPWYQYEDYEDCVADLEAQATTAMEEAQANGLTFDPGCARREIEAMETGECEPGSGGSCVPPCLVYHGDQPVGSPCEVVPSGWGYNDCQQGLYCGLTCQDRCAD